ncbi:hypothetical protein M513_02759 [Trichuris suis]|uniref:Uncharacterized protein n=1 Tax=Trichuris suis TaxID=68888 RepID=A0A085MGF8_9BILA|nr:hypothetical protein M513_02759 [Trichuris suis]
MDALKMMTVTHSDLGKHFVPTVYRTTEQLEPDEEVEERACPSGDDVFKCLETALVRTSSTECSNVNLELSEPSGSTVSHLQVTMITKFSTFQEIGPSDISTVRIMTYRDFDFQDFDPNACVIARRLYRMGQ